ncbi:MULTISPECIES: hypothetical protein [unclassified Streptomyces]|uniref:tetratricopeptide repeat protein n=1 Tax=unclassified Streptomyces TaxID=2593676 RepID=UPI003D8E98D6
MSRLSREPERGRTAEGAASAGGAEAGVTPIEVHVRGDGAPGAGTTVDGVPVVAAPGQSPQEAVLDHLHRLALAVGHPVLAAVRDERIGFVVPIRVSADGASEYAGEPVPVAATETPPPGPERAPDQPRVQAAPSATAPEPVRPRLDKPTHLLRAIEEQQPTGGAATFPLHAVPEPTAGQPAPEPQSVTPGQPTAREHLVAGSFAVAAGPVPAPHSAAHGEAAAYQQATPGQEVPAAVRPPVPHRPAPVQHQAAASRGSAPAQSAEEPPAAGAFAAAGHPVPTAHSADRREAAAYQQATPGQEVPAAVRPPVPHRPASVQYQAAASQGAAPARPVEEPPAEEPPVGDRPSHLGAAVATFMLRALPEAPLISATSGPAQVLPGGGAVAPGTVSAPTGTFGPPPVMPLPPVPPAPAPTWRAPETGPDEPETLRPDFGPDPDSYSTPAWKPTPAPRTTRVAEVEEVKEPPVREFDSVAEAVLAPESGAVPPGGAGGPVAEPMARINAAVKQGRIEEAADLAERTVAEASAALGAEHPDVLRLRELTAYIAYLAADALRSFHLSLDLARLRHRLGDPRGAYGNVQSAAAAWRAVRDPIQGLHLGRDLIAVWTELAAGEGPAVDDLDQLERARSRMVRLAERARNAVGGEHSRGH